jgi:hypothetical protein
VSHLEQVRIICGLQRGRGAAGEGSEGKEVQGIEAVSSIVPAGV